MLHFRTWATSLVSYFKTGVGFAVPAQLKSQSVTLPGHNAALLSCSGVLSYTANRSDLAPTARPFACGTANEWNIGDGGSWTVDEHNTGIASATLHQMWVRPSKLDTTITVGSSFLLGVDRAAVMSHPNLAKVYDGSASFLSRTVVLPFVFKVFGVNYGSSGTAMYLGDNGYLTFGYDSTASSGFTPSAPGTGLFLGAADRSLLYYGLTTVQTSSDLMYATAVIRYYSSATGDDEDQVNLEVTFATDSVNQFIEIRAGTIGYGGTGPGIWGLSDGYRYVWGGTTAYALYSGQSMVLQSDSEGRYWVPHVNSSLDIRAPPAPTVDGAAAAQPCTACCAEAEPVPRFLYAAPVAHGPQNERRPTSLRPPSFAQSTPCLQAAWGCFPPPTRRLCTG